MKQLSFKKYMFQYLGEDNLEGFLARDIKRDVFFPRKGTYNDIREYLLDNDVNRDCLNTFEKCYNNYKDYISQQDDWK